MRQPLKKFKTREQRYFKLLACSQKRTRVTTQPIKKTAENKQQSAQIKTSTATQQKAHPIAHEKNHNDYYFQWGLGFLALMVIIPPLVLGSDNYGKVALATEATNLQAFLFGPVLRIAGVVGSVFGIVRSFQTQSLQPLFIFGGIGAATVIVPKLLDVMFKVT